MIYIVQEEAHSPPTLMGTLVTESETILSVVYSVATDPSVHFGAIESSPFCNTLFPVLSVRSPVDEEGVHDSFQQLIAEHGENGSNSLEMMELRDLDEESRGTVIERKLHVCVFSVILKCKDFSFCVFSVLRQRALV